MRKAFFCEVCGAEVKADSPRCPSCGRAFRGIRCPRCGKEGGAADFRKGCPDCGYSAPRPRSRINKQFKRKPLRERPASFYWFLSLAVILVLLVILKFWLR
ncbi:MAG: hypothetical protein CSA76_03590 [Spirochaetales bacterium]|nr:MAG: hypothetical protein CSA76_03590 [Spirochaetales bacterium]